WSSSDEKVATVVAGKVVAVGVGEAVVTVKSEDGGYTDTCKVTVLPTDIGLKSIKLNESKIKLKKGESSQLAVTFDPADATNKNVTWSSSDEKVATVVAGKVVALGIGEAVVTVKSEDGGYTDTCKVTVKGEEVPEKPEKPNKPELPQTGASIGITSIMSAGIVLAGAGLSLKKKRKNS
ncbi:MAG: Ig-like domain-containing protein, partial [Clostridium sp.]